MMVSSYWRHYGLSTLILQLRSGATFQLQGPLTLLQTRTLYASTDTSVVCRLSKVIQIDPWEDSAVKSSAPVLNTLTVLFMAAVLCLPVLDVKANDYKCGEGDLCRSVDTYLPLRILTRPFSNIYNGQSTDAGNIQQENVAGFKPYYVYKMEGVDYSDPNNPLGWYQIGKNENDGASGWMETKDVIEWRQSLIVSYTHPGSGDDARGRVLGFESKQDLVSLVEAGDRQALVRARYAALQEGEIPDGVIAAEPNGVFLDINETFYVYPVLDWAESEVFDEPYPKYLQLATAVPKERAVGHSEDKPVSEVFRAEVAGEASMESASAGKIAIDIMFVMDLTGSMAPFLDKTLTQIHNLRLALANETSARMKFGFVGYRDSVEVVPAMEYTSRKFTTMPVEADDFAAVLEQIEVASSSSDDYQEEVFAGMLEAIQGGGAETAGGWSPDAKVKFIILVGDASSHPPGHPQNTTGLGAQQLRELANTNDVYVMALHLQDPEDRADWPEAAQQFATLADNLSDDSPAYLPVEAHNETAYADAIKDVVKVFQRLAEPGVESVESLAVVADSDTTVSAATAMATRLAQNALVDVLGDKTKAQSDVTFWAFDHDLQQTDRPALNVHAFTTIKQMDDMVRALEDVLDAMNTGKSTGMGFMKSLQSVVVAENYGREISFDMVSTIAETNLLPIWIKNLPYKSKILGLNDAQLEGMAPDQRSNLVTDIESKLKLYRELLDNPGQWTELHQGDDRLHHVHPLKLSSLP